MEFYLVTSQERRSHMPSHKVPIHLPFGSPHSFVPLFCCHACLRLTGRMRMLARITPAFLTCDEIELISIKLHLTGKSRLITKCYSLVSKMFGWISTLFTVEDDKLSVWPRTDGWKNSKRLSKKSQKALSDGKEQLQILKIRIQNAVPARLVRRRYCVVQHRVQGFIELTTISRIPLAKPPKHPCCK